ncbi:MAG: phosphoserine transaminase [Bifidobacteriaceae bacterium]|nr:phosphoserine transaminase [Bifidobacteriaceae bacterium]
MTENIVIPNNLLPSDGRFGSGPSKIRHEQLLQLSQSTVMGTSHRQAPVKTIVQEIQTQLAQFFNIPDGYEVVLGNGGASAFWDMACAGLILQHAAFGVYGSFTKKFAQCAQNTPFLQEPAIFECTPGDYSIPQYVSGVDTYCWAHNETSTGVAAPIQRVPSSEEDNALIVIDATSAAGALPVDISQTDAYYFSPQKAFGSDGGLWIAILSPRAINRVESIAQSVKNGDAQGRWIPSFLSLQSAIDNSRKHQTLNTPAIATLELLHNQINWLMSKGGLQWSSQYCHDNAEHIYQWAQNSEYASPFVQNVEARSHAVVTVEVDDSINAQDIVTALRENGIIDTFGYRGLNRNQLRIGVFPSVTHEDVQSLTQCIDYVVEHLQK